MKAFTGEALRNRSAKEVCVEELGYLLVEVSKLHRAHAHAALEELGLYRGQNFVLTALAKQEGLAQSELAERLLDDPERWSREEIEKAIRSKKTQTVYLKRPMPVLLLYWTSYVDEFGEVHFLRDVYDRDEAILQDLNAGFRMRERDLRAR